MLKRGGCPTGWIKRSEARLGSNTGWPRPARPVVPMANRTAKATRRDTRRGHFSRVASSESLQRIWEVARKIKAPRRFGRPGADHSPRAHGLRNRNAQGDNTSPGLTLSKAPSGQPLYHRLPNCGGLQSSALDIRKGSEGAHSAREDDQRSREDRGLSENREENLFGSSSTTA